MNIVNKTSFPVIAVCWHRQYGYGEEKTIEPGQSGKVPGLHLGEGEIKGVDHCSPMPGEITCHEGEDNEFEFHVSEGNQLNLGNGGSTESSEFGVTIRHCDNELILK